MANENPKINETYEIIRLKSDDGKYNLYPVTIVDAIVSENEKPLVKVINDAESATDKANAAALKAENAARLIPEFSIDGTTLVIEMKPPVSGGSYMESGSNDEEGDDFGGIETPPAGDDQDIDWGGMPPIENPPLGNEDMLNDGEI